MPPMQNLQMAQPQTNNNNNNNNFVPPSQDRGSISLGMLINFIVQRTYHELTVLAELLPRKTDMERKIEIYNFSARTRQLFIRLLALVKWANSASKVDKSAHIMNFLEKQSMLFVETADLLSKTARETLVHARLPNFHIPAAVEVLTTGSYNRLPSCIKEKIVPPDPITPSEKRSTLARLNQVIQHRLVTGNLLPQMRKFKIDLGRVTFVVEHEFSVALTVMGDGENVPWRLLDIDILVEDKETGDGKALVHTMQTNYIHQLIQTRLADSQQNALSEVYNCLHYFCQSLQLEVLYTQTLRLCRDRLDDKIHVEEYIIGNKLTVSYWRELTSSKDSGRSEMGYKLTIQTDPTNSMKSLAVFHMPSLGTKESEVAERAVRTDLLSMERLLVHTVYVRSVARLNEIKTEFKTFLKDVDYHLQGTPAILTIPILTPCLRAEQIHITVDTHTGMLRCHVPKHLDCSIMTEMQASLNSDHSKLPTLISELRYWITKRRCEKTLQHLPATPKERLPIIMSADHPAATKIGVNLNKMFIQLHRHPNVIIIVGLKEKKNSPCEMEYTFFLVSIKQIPIDECSTDDSTIDNPGGPFGNQLTGNEIPKTFLRVMNLIEFDTFMATHGPGTYVDDCCSGKRKANGPSELAPSSKQQKTVYPAYFIPELAHVVAMCDEKLPFIAMSQELSNRKIPHSGLQIEATATSLVLKLLTLPKPSEIHEQLQERQREMERKTEKDKGTDTKPNAHGNQNHDTKNHQNTPLIDTANWNALMRRLLSVAIRSQINKTNQIRLWVVELVFYSTPLHSTHHKEQGQRRPVYLQYEMLSVDSISKTVDLFLNDWIRIVYLYSLVQDFSEFYTNEKHNLQNIVAIRSYSYTNLLMQYGPNKDVAVNVSWSNDSKEFQLTFIGGNTAINAHSMMRDQMQSHLNHNYNLAQIVHILNETYQPLSSIAKLPIVPQLGIPNPKIPVLSFCVMPQSPTLLRVAFQGCYCLEIRLRGGGLVSIRDGAYSRFDRSNVVEEFTPTQGLKGFLSKYVDENAVYRRRSQSEDDNPPSPMTMEEPHGGPGSVGSAFLSGTGSSGMRGPQSPRDAGLRFAAPLTPPSTSNPHTPASPHPAIGHQSQHPNFNMTSPPTHMPHPSPSAGLMPSSPLNTQPSPMPHSPGPMSYMQGHTDSPFPALSPAASGWPGSPGIPPRPSPRPGQSPDHKPQMNMPHHSRVLPARSWAGAVPTLLTHEELDTLCRPASHPIKEIPGPDLSPLERFLGCVFMKRSLQRLISTEEFLISVQPNEPGVVLFRVDGLQCQVYLNPVHMQSLHIKVTQALLSIPQQQMDMKPQYLWSSDDLQILEQFFELKVASPPYRVQSLSGFTKMLNVPAPVLKDLIQIMKLELMPELGQGLKWNVQFCLRVPPSASPIVPVGTSAIVICRSKILFFLQITRVPYMPGMDWKDCPSLVLPLVYDNTSRVTQLAERREVQSVITTTVNHQLRRFAELCNLQHAESSLFAAVRDLLANLQMPNELPPMPPQQMQNPGPPIMGASPNPQMMPQMVGPNPVGPGPNVM